MGLEFDTPTVDTRAYNSAVEKEKEMVAMCTASHFGDDFLHINKGEPLYVRKEHGALRFEIQMDMRCYWARASCGQYGWVRVDKVGTKKLYHWMMQHEIKEALDTQAQNEKAQQLIEGMGLGEALKKLSVSVVQRVTLENSVGEILVEGQSLASFPGRRSSRGAEWLGPRLVGGTCSSNWKGRPRADSFSTAPIQQQNTVRWQDQPGSPLRATSRTIQKNIHRYVLEMVARIRWRTRPKRTRRVPRAFTQAALRSMSKISSRNLHPWPTSKRTSVPP
eukprot:GEMP01030353.1.p1 GENE.GEMP01030353.1~~GEMP01030353.1.p1  ORF type:complete len:277 (+),score=61.20 GEMP01030353.1:239-1069(+)